MGSSFREISEFLKGNESVFRFAYLIFWPFIVWLWNRRQVYSIDGLDIRVNGHLVAMERKSPTLGVEGSSVRSLPTVSGVSSVSLPATDAASSGGVHEANLERRYEGARIEFCNKTGSVLYVTHARISKCTKNFSVHKHADTDIVQGDSELKFTDGEEYILREVILQTDDVARTCIALSHQFQKEESYRCSPIWRRVLRRPKYFILECVVLNGTRKQNLLVIY